MGETCDWCGEYFPNRLILEVDSEDPQYIEPYCYICFACCEKHPEIKVSTRPLEVGFSFVVAAENAGYQTSEVISPFTEKSDQSGLFDEGIDRNQKPKTTKTSAKRIP